MNSHRHLVLCCLFAISWPAFSETIIGKVIAVTDGDTLQILSAGNIKHKIRLSEIDAPEKRQPYGTRSRQSLAELCHGKVAMIEPLGDDKYKRVLGRVICNGVDANKSQVARGMAWVYDRYVVDKTLYQVQATAQSDRVGLWADPDPVSPWQFRKQRRAGAE